jgi:hypothetical protein
VSKRGFVWSTAGGALVVVIAVALVVINQETGGAQQSTPVSTQSQAKGTNKATPKATPKSTQAEEVAAALAKLSSDPVSLVASKAGPEALAGARVAVPAGSKVDVAKTSWASDGVGGGTVMVTVSPPQTAPVTYAAVMVHESNGWKVLATMPLASSTPVPSSAGTP